MGNAYPDTRWCAMRFRFEFIDQKAQEDASAIGSAQNETSQLPQVTDGITRQSAPFLALDHNRWGLGNSFSPLPDVIADAQTGWITEALSQEDCTFSSDPYLQFDFTEPHSSIGFTIHFEEGTGCHATRFRMQVYDTAGLCVTDEELENHSAVCVINKLSPDYQRVRFTFHELSRPLSRVRIAEVLFGIVEEYTPDTIKEATLNYEVDPTAEALPSREAIVKIDNSSQRFNLINPAGVYAYLQQPQAFQISLGVGDSKDAIEYSFMGEFYFVTVSAEDSGLTAEIAAYDWFYWMDSSTFKDNTFGEWTLAEAVQSILTSAGLSCTVVMDASAAETKLRRVTEAMTHREALRLAVQASCCTAYFDRDSRLVITNLTIGSPTDTLTSNNMETPPKVSMESAVNTVQLTTHDDTTDEDVVFVASNILRDEMPQSKAVTNPMVTLVNGSTVAQWLLSASQNRLTYSTKERGNPETKLGDTVKIYDYFGANRNAVITKQKYTYGGGLKAESEVIRNGSADSDL